MTVAVIRRHRTDAIGMPRLILIAAILIAVAGVAAILAPAVAALVGETAAPPGQIRTPVGGGGQRWSAAIRGDSPSLPTLGK